MSEHTDKNAHRGFWDKILIAIIVLIFTFIGNVLAYRMNADYGHSQQNRQLVVEKTGEIWKGIVDYRTYLDKVSQIEFGGFVTSSTNTVPYSKKLLDARSKALQAKERLSKLISDNSFYIGPVLTREASLYVNYLDGYYEQRDKIYYSKDKQSGFEVKMLENTQKLLNQTGGFLTARSSYAVGSG